MSASIGYEQQIAPDTSITSDAGWCLWFVQEVYHVPHLYRSAWEAYIATTLKHPERIMPDASVPVFFEHWGTYGNPPTYGNWGHVVAYIPGLGYLSAPGVGDGQKVLETLEAVEECFNCKYVGWSEDLCSVKIISKKEDIMSSQDLADETTIRLGWNIGLGDNATQADIDNAIANKLTVEGVLRMIMNSDKHAQLLKDQQIGYQLRKNGLKTLAKGIYEIK